MVKATPYDAKSEALHGESGFVGDYHLANGVLRLYADAEQEVVRAHPASDTDDEFEVDANTSRKVFDNRMFAEVKDRGL